MMVQTRRDLEKQQQIQPKFRTIFKEKVVDIPQAFGSFVMVMEKSIVLFLLC
jgi:hypothetical protein